MTHSLNKKKNNAIVIIICDAMKYTTAREEENDDHSRDSNHISSVIWADEGEGEGEFNLP